jgi:hypothetical protein
MVGVVSGVPHGPFERPSMRWCERTDRRQEYRHGLKDDQGGWDDHPFCVGPSNILNDIRSKTFPPPKYIGLPGRNVPSTELKKVLSRIAGRGAPF